MPTIDERLEKLTERHEALTQAVELMQRMAAGTEERLEKLAERHEALTQAVELMQRMAADAEERHNRGMAAMDAYFRHAVRLAIREARNERKRRQELDARFELKMDQLASAQLLTEEKLQRLIDSMRRGGNGNPP